MITSGKGRELARSLKEARTELEEASTLIDLLPVGQDQKGPVFRLLNPVLDKLFQVMIIIEKETGEIDKTTNQETILSEIERESIKKSYREIFEQFPFLMIRLALIKKMHFNTPESCAWTQEIIPILSKEGNRELIEAIFEKYVGDQGAKYGRSQLGVEAVEFAIKYFLDTSSWTSESVIQKVVNAAFKKDPDLWWLVLNARIIIKKMLFGIWNDSHRGCYDSRKWLQTERAINLIVAEEDITWIEDIEKLSDLLAKKIIKPEENFGAFAAYEQHRVLFRAAIASLKSSKKKQTPDLNRLASELREFAKIDGTVTVQAHPYPFMTCASITNPPEPANFTLRVMVGSTGDIEKMAALLEKAKIHLYGLGFESVMFQDISGTEKDHNYIYDVEAKFMQQPDDPSVFTYTLTLRPTLGSNKFEVCVELAKCELISFTGYFVGEEKKEEEKVS